MPIEKPQHQTPSVMGVPMLRIVEGCTHGKCRFCDIFINEPFKMVPMEQIESDLDEMAKSLRRDQTRINLTGGNPYALPADKLVQVFELVRQKLPYVNSFGGFCRIADIKSKSDEDLKALREWGINDLSIGAEGGWDPALEFMCKGHTAADIVEQGQRMREAGMDSSFFYLVGMAGSGNGRQNAIATAETFSEARPGHVLVVCITPTQTWPLKKEVEEGTWVPPTEIEMIEEIRTFIEHVSAPMYVNVSHDTDILKFEGLIPQDQEKMLQLIDHRLPNVNPVAARKIRSLLHNSDFNSQPVR